MTNGKPEQQKKDSADATDGRLRATDSEKHSTKLLIDHHAGQPTKTTVPNDARGATTRTEVHSTHADAKTDNATQEDAVLPTVRILSRKKRRQVSRSKARLHHCPHPTARS